MGLNIKKMKDIQAGLEAGGKDGFLTTKELKEENDIRIMPPKANMDESYFFKQIVWWFGDKKYISPKTFGKPCPIEEEVEKAIALCNKHPEDEEELARLLDGKKGPSMKEDNLIPVLHLNAEFEKGKPVSVKVIGGKVKVFTCGKACLKAINKIVTSRDADNGTEDGITDRVEGFNIMLGKTGTGLDTEYTAQMWKNPYEMDEKYYEDSAIPDVIEMTKKEMLSDSKLRAAIRQYLYGEAPPKDDEKEERKSDRKSDDRGSKGKSDERSSRSSSRNSRDEDEDDRDSRKSSRSRDDDDDEDDNKRSSKGRSSRDDDEDGRDSRKSSRSRDDDDEKDKKDTKKAATKKEDTRSSGGGKKRSLAEDLDD